MGVENLKQMINSCFTYGSADRDNHQFERYILPYKEELGEKVFEHVYETHLADLKNNYIVDLNVYVDSEGLVYNNLNKK